MKVASESSPGQWDRELCWYLGKEHSEPNQEASVADAVSGRERREE